MMTVDKLLLDLSTVSDHYECVVVGLVHGR